MLNEKWISSPSENGKDNIEITFLADGTYTLKAVHMKSALPDYLDESGTYIFNPETNEIFVSVRHGGYDYPIKIDEPAEYYGLMFSDYQGYYKIEKRDGSFVQVLSCRVIDIDSSKRIEVWQKEADKYKFTNPQNLELKSTIFIKQPVQK